LIDSVQTITSRVAQEVVLKISQSPLTLLFLLLIWSVEVFARFAVDSKMNFNEVMGFQSSEPWTYISYAFAHKDMEHIVGNSVMLLFGMPVESRYGKKVFSGIVGISIVLGALGALLFYLWRGELNDEPAVGASAVGLALLIAGINAIMQARVAESSIGDRRSWIEKSVTWFLVIATLGGVSINAMVTELPKVLIAAAVFGLIVTLPAVGLKAFLSQVQYWELRQRRSTWLRMVQSTRYLLLPLLLYAVLLHSEVTGTTEWFYGNSGHAGGALVGLIASLGANWHSWRKQTRCIQAEMTASSCPNVLLQIGALTAACFAIIGFYSAWALLLLAWSSASTY